MAVGLSVAVPAPAPDACVGTIAGIARHATRRGAMEVIDRVSVTVEGGIASDWRGVRKPGSSGARQVTLMERADWAAAMAEIGQAIPWAERRANLLVDGFDLPQVPGTRLRLGTDIVLEVTCETNPCARMEALSPGLFAALEPDWRGGVCARVLHGGELRTGDAIRIEIRSEPGA